MGQIPNVDNNLVIMKYATQIWEARGRDCSKCEMCGHIFDEGEKWTWHHTKYEGATINDLLVACMKCQMQPENKNLA